MNSTRMNEDQRQRTRLIVRMVTKTKNNGFALELVLATLTNTLSYFLLYYEA